jgi:hypothetical protein
MLGDRFAVKASTGANSTGAQKVRGDSRFDTAKTHASPRYAQAITRADALCPLNGSQPPELLAS